MRQDEQHDESITARTAPGSSLVLQVDKGLSQTLGALLASLWWSSFFSAVATIGFIVLLVVLIFGIRHMYVMQYDFMDFRSKAGIAHENTE